MPEPLLFLKLGGSLITNKNEAETALIERLEMLLAELRQFTLENPNTRVLLGHGSGSFGHHAAAKHQTRAGVEGKNGWLGFVEVWRSAQKLNQIVLKAAANVGLTTIVFPPSACVLARAGRVRTWETEPIQKALQAGLIPVVYGDVVFDEVLGGTILSTEELFHHLASDLKPSRVLLAGIEPAVFADFPANSEPIAFIGKDQVLENFLQTSRSEDVTGGMRAKVSQMQLLCKQSPGSQVEIFTAVHPGELLLALKGYHSGTIIS